MPPKKNDTSKKAEKKAKEKIIEDKTFGLKNKNKSAKVNKYIKGVEQAVMGANSNKAQKAEAAIKAEKERVKKEEEARKQELAQLFKPAVVQPKVPFGVDPKSILCEFFKATGTCAKGDKCKFSHDLNVAKKTTKIDIYTDQRDKSSSDSMENWDQKKLESVIASKQSKQPPTDIVCKYFLEALDTRKYGWFWECPNGGDACKYRHALPPGYVLKSKKKDKDGEDDKEQISLEEFLESERHKLGTNLTPITLETFQDWKRKRLERKEMEEKEKNKSKEAEFRAGKLLVSGKDLFTFNPDLFQDDEDEDDDVEQIDYRALRQEQNEEEVEVVPVDESLFNESALENLDLGDSS